MGSIVQPYLPPMIASRIKEGLACGLVGVVVATWCVVLDLQFLSSRNTLV